MDGTVCETVYGQQLPALNFGLVDLVSLRYNDDARFYIALFSDLEQTHCASDLLSSCICCFKLNTLFNETHSCGKQSIYLGLDLDK